MSSQNTFRRARQRVGILYLSGFNIPKLRSLKVADLKDLQGFGEASPLLAARPTESVLADLRGGGLGDPLRTNREGVASVRKAGHFVDPTIPRCAEGLLGGSRRDTTVRPTRSAVCFAVNHRARSLVGSPASSTRGVWAKPLMATQPTTNFEGRRTLLSAKQSILKEEIQNLMENFIYPNYLDKRNTVALPGHAIVLDLFKLKIVNSKKPGDSFQAIIAVDLATGEIIAHDVFRIPNSLKGEAPAHKVIRVLRDAFKHRTFDPDFIIHTDRGPQFTSQKWHFFVQELGATGSMSEVARPNDNAVAERTIRTIKSQLFQCKTSWPKQVKSLADIQRVFDIKIEFYNHEFQPTRACGITPVKLRPALTAIETQAPPRRIVHTNHDVNHKAVMDFKQLAVLSLKENPYSIITKTRDGVQRIEQQTQYFEQKVDRKLDLIQEKIEALAQARPKKIRRLRLPLRDPADNTVYNWIMRQHRKRKQRRISFLRFRIAITLLRHTGMRAAEVAEVTDQQIETAIEHGHLDVMLTKTQNTHRYMFTQAAREALRELQFERMTLFASHQKLAGFMSKKGWSGFINFHLKPAVQHFGLNLKSHSWRVGYITHLLKYAPVQQAASIVGHRDIRSTIAYNRYVPDRKRVIELLEKQDPEDSYAST